MARDLKYTISGDARDFQRTLKSIDSNLSKSEQRAHKFGRALNVAMGAGAIGVVGAFGKKAISAASDIDESLSKNSVLFGKYAKSVDRFSKSSAASFGISRQAALEATGTFGNLFTALDIAPEKASGMSVSLVQLAADMASFNNASIEDTLLAIQSGLTGETEPLRKFGVNLNDATLRQEALAQGLI
jgi:hypothetical protein